MIFQFFLILTLSSAKVFASGPYDDPKGSNDDQNGSNNVQNAEDTKDAIKYLLAVDSLYVFVDPFKIKLPELSVEAKKLIRQEYTTVFNEIKKKSKLDFSFEFDDNDDEVDLDKKAKAVLIEVDNQWANVRDDKDVRAYFRGITEKFKKNPIYLNGAVLYRFAKFLPDDGNHSQKPDGIFFLLRYKLGGLLGDQLLGNGYSKSGSDFRLNFLYTVIKLSSIRKNPKSNKADLQQISTLLDKLKEEVKNENEIMTKKEGLLGEIEEQNEAAVEAQNKGEAENEAEARRKANAATVELAEKEAEVVPAQNKVYVAATSVLKKLNEVWVKLEQVDSPPCKDLLKEYVDDIQAQPVFKQWFSSLTESDTFKSEISSNIQKKPTGIFIPLLQHEPEESTAPVDESNTTKK